MFENTKVVKYFEYDIYRYMYLPSMILLQAIIELIENF